MTTKQRTENATGSESKPAENASLELTFEDAERPATTRTPKVNPYDASVKALKADSDDAGVSKAAKAVTLPADAVASHVVLMQKAGRANGVTVRNNQRATEDDQVRVTFWTVPAITRKTKEADAS